MYYIVIGRNLCLVDVTFSVHVKALRCIALHESYLYLATTTCMFYNNDIYVMYSANRTGLSSQEPSSDESGFPQLY